MNVLNVSSNKHKYKQNFERKHKKNLLLSMYHFQSPKNIHDCTESLPIHSRVIIGH